MKLCRIVYEMPPPWDGLTPHPYEVTVAQAKQGHTIDVFCGRWPKAGPNPVIKNTTYHPILREPFPGLVSITSSILVLFKYLSWRKKNKPDILHTHGHFAIWIYLYRLILLKHFPWSEELKIPLIVHFHNTAKGRWEKFKKDGKTISPISAFLAWPLAVYSDKWACAVASACVFVSDDNRKEAIEYYKVDQSRIFLVESGVNTSLFMPVSDREKEKSRKEMDLDNFDKVILNLGMQVERKNIHSLIESLKFLPIEYKLVLVGSGDPAYAHKLNEIIVQNNLQDRVRKISYTPYPMVPIAYQVADVFALPSSWEGTPKVVMESLSCGVPAIASAFKLSTDIEGLYYFSDTKPETIATEIKAVVDSQIRVDVQKVRLYYSWDERVKEIDKIYEFAKKNIRI